MTLERVRAAGRGRPALALLAVWSCASASILYLLASDVLGGSGTLWVDDYASFLAPALSALACLRTARGLERGRHRRGWIWLAGALASWSAGGVIWAVYEVHLGVPVPYPGPSDVAYLLFVPLTIAALLTLASDPGARRHRVRLRTVLDAVIIAAAFLLLSWQTVLDDLFRASDSTPAELISLAYPVGDVFTATIALVAVSRSRGAHRTAMLLVGVGLLVVAVADTSFVWFTAHGSYANNFLLDSGYVSGFLLIGIAAEWARSVGTDPARDATSDAPSRFGLALPYAPLLVSLPLTVREQVHGRPLTGLAFWLTLVVVVAILIRQLVSVHSIVALSTQLRDTVTTLRRRETDLQYQAFHDPLTGLANRALFHDRAAHALARTRRPDPVILLLADLDDFKGVNDTLGHSAGDELLIAVAERLRTVVRPGDTAARLGGDEFAILLETARGLADAQVVAERIAEVLRRPFDLAGTSTVVSASVGIAVAGEGIDGEELLRDADIAMYAAKADDQGGYAVYAAELATANLERLQLTADLAGALDAGQLSLKYQPLIDLDTGSVHGVEALLRWRHPHRGDVSPAEFIPLAEESGDILPIGRWVIAQSCAAAGAWQRLRADPVHVAVNLSGRQLTDPVLLETVRTNLRSADLPPSCLTLEITESVLLDDRAVLEPLLALRDLGVDLAIDDFGTGHSALSRLRKYPVRSLKIDRSFIAALHADTAAGDVFVEAIVNIGRGMGIDVVAEGVETPEQLETLRRLGCAQGQGFLFARPADPGVITELLRNDIALADPASSQIG